MRQPISYVVAAVIGAILTMAAIWVFEVEIMHRERVEPAVLLGMAALGAVLGIGGKRFRRASNVQTPSSDRGYW